MTEEEAKEWIHKAWADRDRRIRIMLLRQVKQEAIDRGFYPFGDTPEEEIDSEEIGRLVCKVVYCQRVDFAKQHRDECLQYGLDPDNLKSFEEATEEEQIDLRCVVASIQQAPLY